MSTEPAAVAISAQPPADTHVAGYIAEMCADLHRLAEHRPALSTLAYLLDMARLEASRQVRASGSTPPR